MRRWVIMASLLLATVAPLPAWAGDVEDCGSGETLVKTEPARVVAACRRLAEQGNAKAQYALGAMYEHGLGVPQDHAEAAKWSRKAADQGDVEAQCLLGRLYDTGQGVPQDATEAATWFRKAADQGFGTAQFIIGTFYGRGHGVSRDNVQAYMWLTLAAPKPPLGGFAHDLAVKLARLMTPAEIEKAQALAAAWKPTTTGQ